VARNELDWGAKLLLSMAILGEDEARFWKRGEQLAREVADDAGVPEAGRALAFVTLGELLVSLDRPLEAIERYKGAIKLRTPRPDKCFSDIADVLFGRGEFGEALTWRKRALDAARDRDRRTRLGDEALAEGRPPGRPLEPMNPQDSDKVL